MHARAAQIGLLLLAPVAALTAPGAAAQNVWYVDAAAAPSFGSGTAADPWVSLSFAASRPQVVSGDTILVAPGDYLSEAVRLLDKALEIRSLAGPQSTRLYAAQPFNPGDSFSVFEIRGARGGVVIDGFRMSGGQGTFGCDGPGSAVGGAISVCGGAEVLVRNCEFVAHEAARGGSIFGAECRLRVANCSFLGPGSDALGEAVYLRDARAIFERCVFQDLRVAPEGTAAGKGAMVAEDSQVLIEECVFQRNATRLFGGHLWSRDSTVRIERSTFGPVTGFTGASIAVIGGELSLTATTVRDARSLGAPGAGLFVSGASAHLDRCLFDGNVVVGAARGGAIALEEAFLGAQRTALQNNVAASGGAIHVGDQCTANLLECRLISNVATAEGGGVATLGSGVVDARRTEFLLNVSGAGGAAVIGSGQLVRCTVHRNAGGGSGAVEGPLDVAGSILWRNAPLDLAATGAVADSICGLVASGINAEGFTAIDPLLFGPTSPHLVPGSPAIDALGAEYGLDPDGSRPEIGARTYSPAECIAPACVQVGSVGCVAPMNSTGAPATLTALGASAVMADRLVLAGRDFPLSAPAMVLGSITQGSTQLPGSSGPLCLGGAIARIGTVGITSRLDGSFGYRVPLSGAPVSAGFRPGDTWVFQVWFRDSFGAATSGVSAATVVTLH